MFNNRYRFRKKKSCNSAQGCNAINKSAILKLFKLLLQFLEDFSIGLDTNPTEVNHFY